MGEQLNQEAIREAVMHNNVMHFLTLLAPPSLPLITTQIDALVAETMTSPFAYLFYNGDVNNQVGKRGSQTSPCHSPTTAPTTLLRSHQ